jgi:hypothetical protein
VVLFAEQFVEIKFWYPIGHFALRTAGAPSRLAKSRRLIRSPHRRAAESTRVRQGRAPWLA